MEPTFNQLLYIAAILTKMDIEGWTSEPTKVVFEEEGKMSLDRAFEEYELLTPRDQRLYRGDAMDLWYTTIKQNEQRAYEASGGDEVEPQVSMAEIKKKVNIPAVGDLVDALAGKTTGASVLGTQGGQGELSDAAFEKLQAYTKDITDAHAALFVTIARGGKGLSLEPNSELTQAVSTLATHVHSLMLLIDDSHTGDTLDGL